MAIFNVKDFGAVGNGTGDDSLAFQRALDALDALVPPGGGDLLVSSGGVLFIPAGIYNLTQTLVVKGGTIIQGCGSQASALRFASSQNTTIAGIIIEHSFSVVRDLTIATRNSYNPNAANVLEPPEILEDEVSFPDGVSHSGIILRGGQSLVENCFVTGFEHDGIHIHHNQPEVDVDNWQVRGCLVQANGRHGLFVRSAIGSGHGGISGGCAMGVECAENRKYGFYDHAIPGNTYVACLAQSNGVVRQFGGGYHMSNGHHTLLGCTEDGDAFDTVLYPSIVLGGIVGSMTRDGRQPQYPLEISGGTVEFPAVLLPRGDFSAPGVRSSGVEFRNLSGPILDGLTTMILADSNALPANESRLELRLPDTTIPNTGTNLRGYQLTVKKVDGSKPVVILPPSGQQIDDQSEVTLTAKFSWVTVLWGLDTWHIIGSSPPPSPRQP